MKLYPSGYGLSALAGLSESQVLAGNINAPWKIVMAGSGFEDQNPDRASLPCPRPGPAFAHALPRGSTDVQTRRCGCQSGA